MKKYILVLVFSVGLHTIKGQDLKFGKQTFELQNVTGSIANLNGEKVLKIERELNALPSDLKNLGKTVDEPTYAKLAEMDFENGTIEVKMYSDIQNPSPFAGAAGFIGVAYRIADQDKAFESIYFRPKAGRVNDQFARNHTVQYYAYPDYKFDKLRDKPGKYEGSAPIALREWFTVRIEVNGETAELFVNNAKYSNFIVEKMLGNTKKGSIGLWVDIATVGYFKDLKVTKKALKVKKEGEKVNDI
jgi:hypothetical protein